MNRSVRIFFVVLTATMLGCGSRGGGPCSTKGAIRCTADDHPYHGAEEGYVYEICGLDQTSAKDPLTWDSWGCGGTGQGSCPEPGLTCQSNYCYCAGPR